MCIKISVGLFVPGSSSDSGSSPVSLIYGEIQRGWQKRVTEVYTVTVSSWCLVLPVAQTPGISTLAGCGYFLCRGTVHHSLSNQAQEAIPSAHLLKGCRNHLMVFVNPSLMSLMFFMRFFCPRLVQVKPQMKSIATVCLAEVDP